ncbi:MAG: hypothetical protein PHU03_03685 [Syntrophales bacterium]|nr:hypothetical protein [Syntrophales bacterium]
MAKKTKSDILEKLSALKPHVPTSTRKPSNKTDQKVRKPPAKKAPQRKPATRRAAGPEMKKAEMPAASPEAGTAAQEHARMKPQERHEPGKHPFGGMMSIPFTVFELWRGIFKTWYGMAENNIRYLMNISFWRM